MATRFFYWSRPKSPEHPHVWHRFDVKNKVSGDIEHFRIQDLPESRTEEAFKVLANILSKDEPVYKAYRMYNYPAEIEKLKIEWRQIVKQKMALICIKEGSDEIVGINMNYVQCIEDISFSNLVPSLLSDFWKALRDWLERMNIYHRDSQRKVVEEVHNISKSMCEFEPFEYYGVNEYLSASGLGVATKYRRRGIALELLKTRVKLCNQFGIEMTLNLFSSDNANLCADKAGFKLEKQWRYVDIRRKYPNLPYIQSKALTLKFMKFPKSREVARGRFSLPTLSLTTKCIIIVNTIVLSLLSLFVYLVFKFFQFFLN